VLGDSTYASGAAIKNPVFTIIPNTGVANNASCTPLSAPILCRSMFATTSATTTPISGASRRVQTTATAGFAEADLFPAKFIPGTGAGKPAIKILNFTAQVDCTSTGSAVTATQLVKWSADLDYWVENDPNDGKTQGHYFSSQNIVNGAPTPLHLTESNAATTLAQLAAVNNNPMVFELPDDLNAIPPVVDRQQKDIYLFPQLDVQGQHPSLIVTIATSSGVLAIAGADGRTTSAQLPGALTFTTGVVDPDVAQSNLNVQFGGLTCNAADRR
jgi:hypothetical protein